MKESEFVLPVRGTIATLIVVGTTFLTWLVYQDSHSPLAFWGLVGYLFAAIAVTDTVTTTRGVTDVETEDNNKFATKQ